MECKQEERIAKLEVESQVNHNSIDNLIIQLKSLTEEVKWLIRILFGITLTCAGFLIQKMFF
jgi:hypothetical protein